MMFRRIIACAVAAAALTAFAAGCAARKTQLLPQTETPAETGSDLEELLSQTVMYFDDTPVTYGEYRYRFSAIAAQDEEFYKKPGNLPELRELAVDSLKYSEAVSRLAARYGAGLSEEDRKQVESNISSLKSLCETRGITLENYLRQNFCTTEVYKKGLELELLTDALYEKLRGEDGIDRSEEAVAAFMEKIVRYKVIVLNGSSYRKTENALSLAHALKATVEEAQRCAAFAENGKTAGEALDEFFAIYNDAVEKEPLLSSYSAYTDRLGILREMIEKKSVEPAVLMLSARSSALSGDDGAYNAVISLSRDAERNIDEVTAERCNTVYNLYSDLVSSQIKAATIDRMSALPGSRQYDILFALRALGGYLADESDGGNEFDRVVSETLSDAYRQAMVVYSEERTDPDNGEYNVEDGGWPYSDACRELPYGTICEPVVSDGAVYLAMKLESDVGYFTETLYLDYAVSGMIDGEMKSITVKTEPLYDEITLENLK